MQTEKIKLSQTNINSANPIQRASMESASQDDMPDVLSLIDNIDVNIPDLNIDFFDFIPEEQADTENRYIKPKLVPMQHEQIMYDNAVKFAKEIKIGQGSRYDAIVSGSFIFGIF